MRSTDPEVDRAARYAPLGAYAPSEVFGPEGGDQS